MKLSDYVVHFLADLGLKKVFVTTGGYAVNLIDSLHKEPRLGHVCVHHEQVGAIAVEAYARFQGLGVMISTNAPGALNLLNGIDGAWNDSIPCLFICGQVPRVVWNRSTYPDLKDREIVDIVTIVQTITKYAQYIEEPDKIRYYLEKAIYIAQNGRPGPVLLDIPLDIQKAQIDPEKLVGFKPEKEITFLRHNAGEELRLQITKATAMINKSMRPVVILGGGACSTEPIKQKTIEFIETLGIPVVATWRAFDSLPYSHPLYVGTIGTYGNRRANFTIQNSDLVISLGAHLIPRQTGGEQSTFARAAKKIIINRDPFAFKESRVHADLEIHADLSDFFDVFFEKNSAPKELQINDWKNDISEYRRLYLDVLPEYYAQKNSVNAYVFMKTLSHLVPSSLPVIVDCGGNLIWMVQAFEVKKGQKVFSNMGLSSMGYALAASMGASFATDMGPVICLIGDGGLQVHIQELQTIKYHNLPIKIFVINNKSYGIIKQTIESWFSIDNLEDAKKKYIAVSEDNGYSLPDFVSVAEAYGIKAVRMHDHNEMKDRIMEVINHSGPILCDVVLDEHQKIAPRLEFGNPLEDQHPLLSRDELRKIMKIPLIEKESKSIQGI